MKVMFVGNPIINNSINCYLTKGKWYNPIEYVKGIKPLSKNYYVIKNDYGQERRYKEEYFMTLQQVRDKNLTDLGI